MNDQLQLSPEEIQLLQIARRLGLVGTLLDKTRQAEQAAQKRAAEEKAASLAYRAYEAAVKVTEGTAAGVVVTIVYPYGDGEQTIAVYPPHPSHRTQARARGANNSIDQLVAQLNEAGTLKEATQAIAREIARRGGRWQGLKVALRASWARELARQFLPPSDEASD
jgi:hypothetical protein